MKITAIRGFPSEGVYPCVLLSRYVGRGWFRNCYVPANDLGEVWA